MHVDEKPGWRNASKRTGSIYLLVEPTHGGQARFSDDHFVIGTPELVAEISGTTVSFDMNLKFHVYRRNGVREYIVWRSPRSGYRLVCLKTESIENSPPTPAASSAATYSRPVAARARHAGRRLGHVLGVLEQGVRTKEHAGFLPALRPAGAEINPNPPDGGEVAATVPAGRSKPAPELP